jgi:putative ubiquitin-RnfH superfamily antitoxin RatB of RatAB toxin-antitoxin module
MASEDHLQVTVVYARAPREVLEFHLLLEPGSTVLQALQASGLLQLVPSPDLQTAVIGVWGRKSGLRQVLRANDRVEIYRKLRVDPKVARRERFARQGVRSPGLFAKSRADSASDH